MTGASGENSFHMPERDPLRFGLANLTISFRFPRIRYPLPVDTVYLDPQREQALASAHFMAPHQLVARQPRQPGDQPEHPLPKSSSAAAAGLWRTISKVDRSSGLHQPHHSALPADLRFLEIGSGDCAVQGGAEFLRRVQRQFHGGPSTGAQFGVEKIQGDHVAQWCMACVVVGDHRLR